MTTSVAGAAALAPAATPVLRMAVDTGACDHTGAEAVVDHLAAWVRSATAGRVAEPVLASTHLVPGPRPRVAAVATWPAGPDLDTTLAADVLTHAARELGPAAVVVQTDTVRLTSPGREPDGAWVALAEHETRRSGRLARFPGLELLTGRLSVREVEQTTAIEAVVGLAGCPVTPDSVLDLDGRARPTWTEQGCVLLVRRGAHGLVPYEARHQHACCTDH